jgi:hypothetical protein
VTARLTIQGTAWIPIIPVLLILIKHNDVTATFTEFLETLNVWEQELFSYLHMEAACYEFLSLVESQILEESAI